MRGSSELHPLLLALPRVRCRGQDPPLHWGRTLQGPPADHRQQTIVGEDWVLISLVLYEKRMLRVVDELTDALAPVSNTPNQVRVISRSEGLPRPIGLKAFGDLGHLMGMRGDDCIVTGLR